MTKIKSASPLSDYDKFNQTASSTTSVKEFLIAMGLRAAGGNFKAAKKWSDYHGIPLPKYNRTLNNPSIAKRIPDDEVFVEDSTYTNRDAIKVRLIGMGWEYVCSGEECTVSGTWLGSSIVLHLDHINGVSDDNRLKNLRFLCPNCHSQTNTYCGRNKIPKIVTPTTRNTKIIWPSLEDLTHMVDSVG